jgi:hypothetical protein
MSKKARRRKTQQRRPAAVSTLVQMASPALPPDQTADKVTPAADSQEYRYVITDLRRVGILAAAMFALLIVLSFVIR